MIKIDNNFSSMYSYFILLSLLLNCILVVIISKIKKIDKNLIITSLVYNILGIILGGKLLAALVANFSIKDIDIYNSGLSSYGGAIGGIISILLYCIQFKVKKRDILAIYIIPLPLIYAVGKLGCFFTGCCFGIEYSGLGSVIYSNFLDIPNDIKLFPIQLLETIINIIIFIFIFSRFIKYKDSYKAISSCFILSGLCKFLLDYMRYSHINEILSVNQIISVIFIIVGIVIYFKTYKDNNSITK